MGSVISKLLEEERVYRRPRMIKNFNMKSVIKWQTEEPKESGIYIVTTSSNIVRTSYWNNDCWLINDLPFSTLKIKAWCKLSDIEPYKE